MKRSLLFAALLLAACAPHKRTAPSGQPAVSGTPVMGEQKSLPAPGAIPATAERIKVALLLPLSGESAAIGNSMLDAASMALYDAYLTAPPEQIRAQIVLLPRDTGNTPAAAVAAAREAIAQGARFIIGPMFSQSVSAVAPLAAEAHIPMLTFSNNKAVATESVFTFGFLPEQQVMRMAEYAYLNKYQRIAVLAPNDSYGEKVKDVLSEAYSKKGGRVSPGELYAPSPANIDAAVSRVAASYANTPPERRFQAIFIADGGAQLKSIVASLKKTNIDLSQVKLLGTGLWDDPEILKIPEMKGAWFPSSPPSFYASFEQRFHAMYRYKPARLASLAYDAAALAARLSMQNGEAGLQPASITAPDGFISPANGVVRLRQDGSSERRLDILEVTPMGFKVIDVAPMTFDLTR